MLQDEAKLIGLPGRERIAEIRMAWPTMFQSVIEGHPDTWLTGRDEYTKQRLDRVSLRVWHPFGTMS